MKKTPISAKLRLILILCCVIVLAVRIYKHHVMSTKLESVLSFEKLDVDQCTIGPPFYDSQMTLLDPDEANPFAKQFASQVRKHFNKMSDGLFEFIFTHTITFKDNDSTWEFMFGYVPHEAFLEYRTTTPPLEGTILLDGEAGPQLQALIERFAAEEPNTRSSPGDMDSTILDIRKDPNAYYDGCVSCTLVIEKRGFLFKRIFVKGTFKNETDYPVPVEEGYINVIEGIRVWYNAQVLAPYPRVHGSREPSRFPWEYYIFPPHATYVSSTNLSKHYDLSKKGKYKVKYWRFNHLDPHTFGGGCYFVIESEPVEFEK